MIHITQTQATQESWEHHLLIDLGKPCTCLSSAVLGAGFSKARYIINKSVPKNWQCNDPEASMRKYAEHLGVTAESCVGLLTAVGMHELQSSELQQEDWVVKSFVTAGVGNAARAGGQNPLTDTQAGTINIIIIIFGCLSEAALVGAVQTATEAKVAALQDAGIQTRFLETATGTTTDAIVIINYLDEPKTPYAGLATTAGYLIGQTVYNATLNALKQ